MFDGRRNQKYVGWTIYEIYNPKREEVLPNPNPHAARTMRGLPNPTFAEALAAPTDYEYLFCCYATPTQAQAQGYPSRDPKKARIAVPSDKFPADGEEWVLIEDKSE